MKKIKVTDIDERDGHYEVFLYPSRRVAFTSKAKAEAYLRKESKILTDRFYKDMEIFKMINNEYLSHYGNFRRQTGLAIESLLHETLESFDRAVYRRIENYRTTSFIVKAEHRMFSILELMRDSAKKNSDTPFVYSIDTISNMLDLESLDQESSVWSIKVKRAS